MVLQLVRQVVGEFRLALHGLAEQCRRDFGEEGQHVGVVAGHGGLRSSDGGAVDDCQTLLGLQLEGLQEADLLQSLGRGQQLAILRDGSGVGATGDQSCNVRQWDQISRRGDGSSQREPRGNVLVQQLLHGLENFPPDAREALHESVGPYQHGGPGGGHREDAGPVRENGRIQESDELLLEVDSLVGPPVGGGAEARGDAVGVSSLHHVVRNPVVARVHAVLGRGRIEHDRHFGIPGHGRDLCH
ncbi:hypothetical protein Mapa_005675 [Marchantia paleacea]|nr:hypothetical protein Mapa_005675 [Marchantia paleacea]